MLTAHFRKYDALVDVFGAPVLKDIIARHIKVEEIKKAVSEGDESLNSIKLARWDGAAMGMQYLPQRAAGRVQGSGRVRLSLSERVCLLKHVAKYYIAGVQV